MHNEACVGLQEERMLVYSHVWTEAICEVEVEYNIKGEVSMLSENEELREGLISLRRKWAHKIWVALEGEHLA